MLRRPFMPHRFALNGPAMEEAGHDIALFREFAGPCGDSRQLEKNITWRFRHLLEKHRLAEPMLAAVNESLQGEGRMIKEPARWPVPRWSPR